MMISAVLDMMMLLVQSDIANSLTELLCAVDKIDFSQMGFVIACIRPAMNNRAKCLSPFGAGMEGALASLSY